MCEREFTREESIQRCLRNLARIIETEARLAPYRIASDDPETLAGLRAYADRLLRESGWPVVFHEFLVITSGGMGGIVMLFRTTIDPGRPGGLTAQEIAFQSLTRDERRARWKAILCGPELEAVVAKHGLFSSHVPGGSGTRIDARECLVDAGKLPAAPTSAER